MKIVTRITALFLILLVSGCSNVQISKEIKTNTDNLLTDVQDKIIVKNSKVENKERFDEFFNNVLQGKEDNIRIIKYTTEGAPIFYDYEFEKNVINVTIDTSRDGYGNGEIFNTTCTAMKVNEDIGKTSYELEHCTPIGDSIILSFE